MYHTQNNKSIRSASDILGLGAYHCAPMPKHTWKQWGARFRQAIADKPIPVRQAVVAERLGVADSTLRSWLNGSRDINLVDFFRICAAGDVDPRQILFEGQESTEPEEGNTPVTMSDAYRHTDEVGRSLIDIAVAEALQRGQRAKRTKPRST